MLTWNIYHGRAVPPAGRPLLAEFSAALAGWAWDVALLQEVPPWWPAELAAQHRSVLTSRNSLLAARRRVAERWPDAIRSNGGGANAILVRRGTIAEHRAQRLRRWPERRWAHGVRLESGEWFVNLHASVHERAPLDVAEARAAALEWAAGAPVVLGGDLNTARAVLPGFVRAGAHGIDQVWVRGFDVAGKPEVLDTGALSDHRPLLTCLAAGRTPGA